MEKNTVKLRDRKKAGIVAKPLDFGVTIEGADPASFSTGSPSVVPARAANQKFLHCIMILGELTDTPGLLWFTTS